MTGDPPEEDEYAIRYRFIRGNKGGFLGWHGEIDNEEVANTTYSAFFWDHFTRYKRETLEDADKNAFSDTRDKVPYFTPDIAFEHPINAREIIHPKYMLPTKR